MKKLSRLTMMVTIFAIAGGIFICNKINVRAQDIGAGDYYDDPETEEEDHIFVIERNNYNPENNTLTIYGDNDSVINSYELGNITVPDGCTLIIGIEEDPWSLNTSSTGYAGTITVNQGGLLLIFNTTIEDNGIEIHIEEGGVLNLFDSTIPNSVINPESGACIGIKTGYSGFPTGGFAAYHWDGLAPITAEENIDSWTGFAYDSSLNNNTGGWVWDDFPDGKPEIIDAIRACIFAYTGPYDEDTFKSLLATELYNKFFDVNMYGFYWYSTRAAENASLDQKRAANSQSIENIIEMSDSSGQITVNNDPGNTRVYYTATIRWGRDKNNRDNEVVSTIPVFVLNSPQEFLVCTDQNYTTGMGTNYFVRTVHDDQTYFAEETGTFGEHNMEQYVVMTDNIGNVVIGGDGASFDVFNTEGMYSAQVYKYSFETSGIPGNEYGGFVRVLNPSDTYIAVIGDGEPYKTDGMALNGFPTDNVWKTGENASARVFIGDTTIYIEPLNLLPGYGYNAITDVSLADETQRDGVEIDKTNLTRVSVTFKSNFYDSVPLSITYAGGVTRTLIIERIGLIMRYLYLYHESNVGTINCDCNPDATHTFNYNYAAGENILVYATYYHPTNYTTASGGNDLYLNIQYENGTQRIIGHTDAARDFSGYSPAGNGAVATTTFIIDIIPGGNEANTTYPAFYATVMNAGFNDDTTYGGTQTGSGKGVYWDGHIYWIRRGL